MPLRFGRRLLDEETGPPGPPSTVGRTRVGTPTYGEVESQFLPAAPGVLMTAEEFERSTGGRALTPGDVASFVRGGIGAGEAGPPPPPPPVEAVTGGGTPTAPTAAGAPLTVNPMVARAVAPPQESGPMGPVAPAAGPPGPPPAPSMVSFGFAGPGGGGPPPAPTPEQMLQTEQFGPRQGRYGAEASSVEGALSARGVPGGSLFERIMALGPERQQILTELIRQGVRGYGLEEPTRRPGRLFEPGGEV